MNKLGRHKINGWLVFGVIAMISILAVLVWAVAFRTPSQQTGFGETGPQGQSNANPNFNPAASWDTVDHFTSAAISGGTEYVKVGATVDATGNVVGGGRYIATPSNVNPGTTYVYFQAISESTATSYVKPLVYVAGTGNNLVMNTEAYYNYTMTPSGYDLVGRGVTTGKGNTNATLAANGIANIEYTYSGVAQKSNLPFGGLFVVEMNSTISSVTCSGQGISQGIGPYHLTYTAANTANKPVYFTIDNTFDTGTGNLIKHIDCQFQNGGTAPGTGVAYYFKIYPANYYLGNDGNFYLDTEKYANNGDSTRTGLNGIGTLTSYWA